MFLVDVNILINAVHKGSPDHLRLATWLDERLRLEEGIGLPWVVLLGFVRITTNPRITEHPFTRNEALAQVGAWLKLLGVEVLHPTGEHARHFEEQCLVAGATGNLVTDARLAALAVEHDCKLASTDADFAKFPAVRWVNPMAD